MFICIEQDSSCSVPVHTFTQDARVETASRGCFSLIGGHLIWFVLYVGWITITLSFTVMAQTSMTFHRGNIGEPDSLDPHLTTSGYSGNIIFEMFVGLTALDAFANIIPGAAHSWSIEQRGTVYTFYIRDGMQWSDGTAVRAADFEYAFKRILDPRTASRAAPMLYVIKNGREVNAGLAPLDTLAVRALDASTLEVRVHSPTPFFLELVAHRAFPVPRWTIEAHGRDWTRAENIVVNGPFILAEWNLHNYVRLIRNPLYFEADNVTLSEVYYHPTENLAVSLKRYRAGELDMVISFPPSQLELIKENMAADLRISQNLGLEYFVFNTAKAPFDDKRVRQALAMALDRVTLTGRVMRGGEKPAYSIVPPGSRSTYGTYDPAYPSWMDWDMNKRRANAVELLADAGFSKAKPLTFTFRYNTHEVHKRVAIAAAAMWKMIGVDVTIQNSELNVLNMDLRNGDYQVARYQWFAEHRDPSTFLYLLESGSIGDNHSKYSNPVFDSLLEQNYRSGDVEKRARFMHEAERIAMEDMPLTPVNYYVSKRLVKPFVRGFQDNVRGINRSHYVSIDRH